MSIESILREVDLYKGAIDRDEMRAWYTDRIVDLHLPPAEHEADMLGEGFCRDNYRKYDAELRAKGEK